MDGLQKSVTNSCPLPSPHPGEDSTNLGNQSGGSHLIKGFHIKKTDFPQRREISARKFTFKLC